MPSGYYGVYFQGAIFHKEDFNPIKVIKVAAKEIKEISLPDRINEMLEKGGFDRDVALKICKLLDIEVGGGEKILDYSYISNIFLRESDDWFEDPDPLMGSPLLLLKYLTMSTGSSGITIKQETGSHWRMLHVCSSRASCLGNRSL